MPPALRTSTPCSACAAASSTRTTCSIPSQRLLYRRPCTSRPSSLSHLAFPISSSLFHSLSCAEYHSPFATASPVPRLEHTTASTSHSRIWAFHMRRAICVAVCSSGSAVTATCAATTINNLSLTRAITNWTTRCHPSTCAGKSCNLRLSRCPLYWTCPWTTPSHVCTISSSSCTCRCSISQTTFAHRSPALWPRVCAGIAESTSTNVGYVLAD